MVPSARTRCSPAIGWSGSERGDSTSRMSGGRMTYAGEAARCISFGTSFTGTGLVKYFLTQEHSLQRSAKQRGALVSGWATSTIGTSLASVLLADLSSVERGLAGSESAPIGRGSG